MRDGRWSLSPASPHYYSRVPAVERVRGAYTAARPWAAAAFFFTGFVWDAVTLGRRITSVDLFIVLGYLAAAGIILVLLGRQITFRGSQYLSAALQFFFGGTFSALLVFYFLSASTFPAYAVVFLRGVLLVGN